MCHSEPARCARPAALPNHCPTSCPTSNPRSVKACPTCPTFFRARTYKAESSTHLRLQKRLGRLGRLGTASNGAGLRCPTSLPDLAEVGQGLPSTARARVLPGSADYGQKARDYRACSGVGFRFRDGFRRGVAA